MGATQSILDSSHVREPMKDNMDFKGAVRNLKNHPKGELQKKQQSWRIFHKVVKSSLSLIGFNRYPDMWEVQTTSSLSHNLEKTPLKSSLSLIGFIRYPDMWEVQTTLGLSQNLKKVRQDIKSPLKIPLWAVFGRFWSSWWLLWSPSCLLLPISRFHKVQ